MWKRALIVLATGAIVPIGLAGPAAADIPSGTELPGAGPFCSFPILIQDVRNNRRETDIHPARRQHRRPHHREAHPTHHE